MPLKGIHRFWLIPLVFFLYHLFNVNYSALTYPFWDHVMIGRTIIKYFEHTLTWGDLWAPHNHSRPLLMRLIYILNAHLTNWDIRSEFNLNLLAVALQLISLALLTERFNLATRLKYPALVIALCSALICSPAGHNNHWWSFMFQLEGASVFSIWAIAALCFAGDRLLWHLLSIALVWCSALFISNGLFLHIACTGAALLIAKPNSKGIILRGLWIASLIALAAIYVPGVESSSRGGAPSIVDMAKFVLLYLGMPVGQLIWFQFNDMYGMPGTLWPNLAAGLFGVGLLLSALLRVWGDTSGNIFNRVRSLFSTPVQQFALIAIGYAFLSAIGTGWGRITFDEHGVFNANVSRYSVFSNYFWFGLALLLAATDDLFGRFKLPRLAVPALALVALALTAQSFYRGERMYSAAHNFNVALGEAWTCPVGRTEFDNRVFPDVTVVPEFRWSLYKLGLGPYNHPLPSDRTQVSHIGKFIDTTALSNTPVELTLPIAADKLAGLQIQVVTFKDTQSAYPCTWNIAKNSAPDKREILRSGEFNTKDLTDWGFLRLYFNPLTGVTGQNLVLSLSCHTDPGTGQLAALPVYEIGAAGLNISERKFSSNPIIKGAWNIWMEFLPC